MRVNNTWGQRLSSKYLLSTRFPREIVHFINIWIATAFASIHQTFPDKNWKVSRTVIFFGKISACLPWGRFVLYTDVCIPPASILSGLKEMKWEQDIAIVLGKLSFSCQPRGLLCVGNASKTCSHFSDGKSQWNELLISGCCIYILIHIETKVVNELNPNVSAWQK